LHYWYELIVLKMTDRTEKQRIISLTRSTTRFTGNPNFLFHVRR
jgi:hypothetical protein